MNNLTKRAITGAIYVAITAAALMYSEISAALFLFLVAMFCLWEFLQLMLPKEKLPGYGFPVILGAIAFAVVFLNQGEDINTGYFTFPLVLSPFLLFAAQIFSERKKPIQYVSVALAGTFFIVIPFALLLRTGSISLVASETHGGPEAYDGWRILIVFIIVWLNDTFAYLTGKWLGKTPLIPRVSPKKTVEGLIGGILVTNVIILFLVRGMLPDQVSIVTTVALTNFVIAFAVLGDLSISRLKRSIGVKDSGTILPGHGGFLDRFDSFILGAPAAFIFYTIYPFWS